MATLDRLEERLDAVIGIGAREFTSLSISEGQGTALLLEMNLHVGGDTSRIDELESVSRKSMHVVVSIGSAAVGEQDHDLMDGLGVLAEVVPEHVGILEMGLGVTLLGVDEVGELGGVTDEEDGSVVEDPVKVTLGSPDLDSKATRITGGVCGTRLASDGGEADGSSGLVAYGAEEGSAGKVRDVVSDLNVSVGSGTLGMNDSLCVTMKEKID